MLTAIACNINVHYSTSLFFFPCNLTFNSPLFLFSVCNCRVLKYAWNYYASFVLYKFVILLLCNLKESCWKFFLTSKLWDIAEAAGTAVYLVLWKRRIIQLLYDIPFGKQEKMRVCFLSWFLVWKLSSLEKKKALYCTKEDVECLHLTCCPIMEYSKFLLSRRKSRLQKVVV